jgi:tRNA pseudouridine32 synthase/23S rRNA pseudouridine746 synthase
MLRWPRLSVIRRNIICRHPSHPWLSWFLFNGYQINTTFTLHYFERNWLLMTTMNMMVSCTTTCSNVATTGEGDTVTHNLVQQQSEYDPTARVLDGSKGNGVSEEASIIPENVRQFERQMKKARAAARVACPIPIDSLRVIYVDASMVVIDKPSGTLSVPGLRGNPSMAQLAFDAYGCESGRVDKMIVHRLDMDTSGILVFVRTEAALKALNRTFRDHKVQKSYEALVCGTLVSNEGEIHLPIQRDHEFPPFMRVSTEESERDAAQLVENLQHFGYKKLLRKYPKQCLTKYSVISREMFHGTEPVTRLSLTPVTGRYGINEFHVNPPPTHTFFFVTIFLIPSYIFILLNSSHTQNVHTSHRTHQLRVHCAAIGHPIVADQTYGYLGEGCENGGLDECTMNKHYPHRACLESQQRIDSIVREYRKNLCLHARRICLPHPDTGEMMTFDSPAPF